MLRHFNLRNLLQRFRGILQTLCLSLMTVSISAQPFLAADVHATATSGTAPNHQNNWSEQVSPEEKIHQLLNRITFGARPGDVERVREMGLNNFLDEQLHPEEINDSAVKARVRTLPTLVMTPAELMENYPPLQQAARLARRQGGKLPPAGAPPPQPASVITQKMPRAGQPMMDQQGPLLAEQHGPQGPQRVIMELAQEEVLRAAYSERQLQEVMVQFWMNHFNIFAPKGADKWLTTSFERDTIRPRVLGRFEDLLVATAESPAMLFYLDNWLSATPNPTYAGNFGPRMGKPAPPTGRRQSARRPQFGVWRPFGRSGRIRARDKPHSVTLDRKCQGRNLD